MGLADRPISADGLREVQAALKAGDGESQKQLRVVLNDAAEVVAGGARRLVASRSGRARGSVRSTSSQREARVSGGGARAKHYGWLDFGGTRIGRGGGKATRPFLKDGRYIYATYNRRRPWVLERLGKGLDELIERTGLRDG